MSGRAVKSRRAFLLGFLALTAALPGLGRAADREPARPVQWEKDIAAFEERDRNNPPPKNAILFVGSSSIRRWDVAKSFPGMKVINRGFGGSQLDDSVTFAPRIVLKYEPRKIVLYAGDNDIASGKSPEQVASDFHAFAQVVHRALPKTPILYLSIKPSLLRWGMFDRMRKANALIEAECKKDSRLVYLDVATPMLGRDGKPLRELFAPDGLHLSEKGYQLWVSLLLPQLRKENER